MINKLFYTTKLILFLIMILIYDVDYVYNFLFLFNMYIVKSMEKQYLKKFDLFMLFNITSK